MRDTLGIEEPPVVYEVDKSGIRLFARAVGHTDPVYYDEACARARGFRSLPAPEGFLGTAVTPREQTGRVLNGGTEYHYYGVSVCAGDVLTAVARNLDFWEQSGPLGATVMCRRETTFTNQSGQLVARVYDTQVLY
ncbi:MAG: MaoC family dehydratase N-terminal domain-containing protein [Candidatus Eremiobacteraeota bacterium]|nr:MaoC family dehydratase N-terminal domain-containing protein [Candidatus Eremiobacteraeota bacterium]MCW5868463.1 MaoC family dehydratase N-terminal domain-containing protein [Candidatus Eremiobacteraeota bacterium]